MALAVHGLALLLPTRRTATPSRSVDQAPQFVDLEPTPDEPAPEPLAAVASAPALAAAEAARIPGAVRGLTRVAAIAQDAPSLAASDGAVEPEGAGAAPAATGVAGARPPAPERKIDLGLDGHFFMRPESEVLPRAHKSEFQRNLEATLSAGDVQRGLARGNAFIGSLSAAARADGPTRGEARVSVTIGVDGSLTDVRLTLGSEADWAAVLRSFRRLALSQRGRVPPGARGLRVTFSVLAKVQRPSGKEVFESPIGVARPSLAPNGLVPHGDFDLADLAGGAQRLVYTRVVSEDVL